MLAMAGLNTRGGAEMAAWAANDSVKTATTAGRPAPQSVIDEVIWVVGDEPILKSEVEITRLQSEAEGIKWDGDPDCQIPEQIAVQKLFLHQAALDSIEVTESEINQAVDQQINYWLSLPTIDARASDWNSISARRSHRCGRTCTTTSATDSWCRRSSRNW